MDKLLDYIRNNSIVSPYTKEIHDIENITFYEATINVTFNNTPYQDSICDLSFNPNNYHNRLYNSIINKIIYDLGQIKLYEIFNN